MKTVGAFEAKTHFSALLETVEQGEHVVITRHGKAVAELIPIERRSKKNRRDAIERLKEFSRKHSLGGIDWKELRDEGRR